MYAKALVLLAAHEDVDAGGDTQYDAEQEDDGEELLRKRRRVQDLHLAVLAWIYQYYWSHIAMRRQSQRER